ncbi:MAG: BolA/IbaG family iron-sulfur metabolism protein [Pseudomonadota bacterium]
MTPEQVSALIEAGMPDAQVIVKSDDNTHFEAQVIDAGFDGLRSLKRHQQVYATLGELMGREIHALALQTYTPAEWQAL